MRVLFLLWRWFTVYKPLLHPSTQGHYDWPEEPARVPHISQGLCSPSKPQGPRAHDFMKTREQPILTYEGPNACGKWQSLECPVTCKTIKPGFCNPINKRIASFVLFLTKCKSCPLSFLSSLQPWKHTESPIYQLQLTVKFSTYSKPRFFHFNLLGWHFLGNV